MKIVTKLGEYGFNSFILNEDYSTNIKITGSGNTEKESLASLKRSAENEIRQLQEIIRMINESYV